MKVQCTYVEYSIKGKYLFTDSTAQTALDDNWEHTQLRVVRCQALVVCRAPAWQVVITSLPCCTPLTHIPLDQVSSLYECQQIRSYKSTAVILFTEKKAEQVRGKHKGRKLLRYLLRYVPWSRWTSAGQRGRRWGPTTRQIMWQTWRCTRSQRRYI